MKKQKLKTDKYRSARGGHSRMLEISCKKCENKILKYQKDGPGPLLRMYIDRIHTPTRLAKLKNENVKDIPILKCAKCKRMIGVPYIYKKEKRKAFRVFQNAVSKKRLKLK